MSVDFVLFSSPEASTKKNTGWTINVNKIKFCKIENLTEHIRSFHEGKKPHDCLICDFKCSNKEKLTEHIASVNEGEKPIEC